VDNENSILRGLCKTDVVKVFSADPQMLAFAQHLCDTKDAPDLASFCTGILEECLGADKPEAISIYLTLYVCLQRLKACVTLLRARRDDDVLPISSFTLWNVKLVVAYYLKQHDKDALIRATFIRLLEHELSSYDELTRSIK
jgi:hypothetical protein